MAFFYISRAYGDGSIVTRDGVDFTVLNPGTSSNIRVSADDTYMIGADVGGRNYTFSPSSSLLFNLVPTIVVETGTADGGDISFNNNGVAELTPTVVIQDGVIASGKNINLNDTIEPTVIVGEGNTTRIGNISSSDENANITLSDNSRVGSVTLNGGDDALSIGNNVTTGTLSLGSGNDDLSIGDGATTGNINTGTGDDSVSISDGATTGNINTSTGDDSVSINDGVTTGEINLGDGSDALSIGDNTTTRDIDLGADSDSATIGSNNQLGLVEARGGDDNLTFGNDNYLTSGIRLADGDDTLLMGDRNTMGDGNSTTDDYVNGGSGNDVITVGDDTWIRSQGIDGNGGNDSITVGSNYASNGASAWNIFGAAGDDTITIQGTDPFDFTKAGDDRFYVAGGGQNDTLVIVPPTAGTYTWIDDEYGTRGQTTTLPEALSTAQAAIDAGTAGNSQIRISDDDGNELRLVEFEDQVCFAAGTTIQTDRGDVAVETLSVGDLVETRDNGLQPIRWIGSNKLDAATLDRAENLRPIRIRRHALDVNVPDRDLLVSPQHRILVRSKIAQRMFGTDEVLVAAKHLRVVDGIDTAEDMAEVEYVHFLFDQHEVVYSNGAETESLYTGPQALATVGAAALEEIFAIFPELQDRDYTPVAARPLVKGRLGRKLAIRHHENKRPLVS